MECPFCAETIRDEAIACKNCSRDLRVSLPVLVEIHELALRIDRTQYELDRVLARLDRVRSPTRYVFVRFASYVILPAALLMMAHIVVTIVLDVSPLYLRLASLIIPIPFGLAAYSLHKVSIRESIGLALACSLLSVAGMLCVTGFNDHVAVFPTSWREWREVAEYSISIALAFVSGSLCGFSLFHALPRTLSHGGKPNTLAFQVARILGPHLGEDHLRRRARSIQDFVQTAIPLVGVAITTIGSAYAGLKGVLGS